jgi:hypothetical protein
MKGAAGADAGDTTHTMLIDSYMPRPEVSEQHAVEIAASGVDVYESLWTADLAGSIVIKALIGLRTLPARLLRPQKATNANQRISLQNLIEAGFGKLAEDPGREIVLGITGPFWRPVGNTLPFNRTDFDGLVRPGLARAVWNFSVRQTGTKQTTLATETRVSCGDDASRLKFRLYWFVVRPFSGVIRRIMLKAIKQACESKC